MQGNIWVESVQDQGSVFYFTASFEYDSQTQAIKDSLPLIDTLSSALVIEKNESCKKVILNMMEAMHIKTKSCNGIKSGIDILSSQKDYDLVIFSDQSDHTLEELMQLVKLKVDSPRNMHIIRIYSMHKADSTDYFDYANIDAAIYKPVTPTLLANAVMNAIGKLKGYEPFTLHYHTDLNPESYSLQNVNVLLVEDNEINQELASVILMDAGIHVVIASNGEEALSLVKRQNFDVILMDVQMPVMDGFETTRLIREDTTLSKIPIIAMTANVYTEIKDKCIQVGMNGYISKPFNRSDLYSIIAEFVPDVHRSNDLSKIEGVELEQTLTRLNSNRTLLNNLLIKFSEIHLHDVAHIQEALKQGDHKRAILITHTLKGTSGNLGAQRIHLLAGKLESDLRKNLKLTDESPLLELSEAISELVNSVSLLRKDDSFSTNIPNAKVSSNEERSILLTLLEKYINEHDIDAISTCDALMNHIVAPTYVDLLNALKKALEHYDFENAKHLLASLKDQINIDQEVSHE
jgi:CheY-like chemotaxis protein